MTAVKTGGGVDEGDTGARDKGKAGAEPCRCMDSGMGEE